MFSPVDLRSDSGRRCGGAVVHGRRRDLLDRCILPMIGNPLTAICSWPKRQSKFGDRPITETMFDINMAADDCTKGSVHINEAIFSHRKPQKESVFTANNEAIVLPKWAGLTHPLDSGNRQRQRFKACPISFGSRYRTKMTQHDTAQSRERCELFSKNRPQSSHQTWFSKEYQKFDCSTQGEPFLLELYERPYFIISGKELAPTELINSVLGYLSGHSSSGYRQT